MQMFLILLLKVAFSPKFKSLQQLSRLGRTYTFEDYTFTFELAESGRALERRGSWAHPTKTSGKVLLVVKDGHLTLQFNGGVYWQTKPYYDEDILKFQSSSKVIVLSRVQARLQTQTKEKRQKSWGKLVWKEKNKRKSEGKISDVETNTSDSISDGKTDSDRNSVNLPPGLDVLQHEAYDNIYNQPSLDSYDVEPDDYDEWMKELHEISDDLDNSLKQKFKQITTQELPPGTLDFIDEEANMVPGSSLKLEASEFVPGADEFVTTQTELKRSEESLEYDWERETNMFYFSPLWNRIASQLSGFYTSDEFPDSFICLRDIQEIIGDKNSKEKFYITRLKGYWFDIDLETFQRIEIAMQFGFLVMQKGSETYELKEDGINHLSWRLLGAIENEFWFSWRKYKSHNLYTQEEKAQLQKDHEKALAVARIAEKFGILKEFQ